MNPNHNEGLLELYTQAISLEALKDAEQFLENSLLGKDAQVERLLAQVLIEEQQIETNRKKIAQLRIEKEELEFDCANSDLKSLEQMQAERDELQRKCQPGQHTKSNHKSSEQLLRMKKETDALRAYMKKISQFED
ncbi:KNL (kinetochore null) Binding Protein [Caenorhabditis elegans]|uniref:KNL (Kinetochore null) Binding Protein n=1 Tax=Caenorhabditis elegans TaxID=6239 RepID=O44956_CAEEL|nr:KNL (kinetochore null) Binding Protein [Caenorhabditis elegans]CCD62120.1 KNL (kinetochore null) Binding Protein [Caenorhabditis elegans]|eukprot:NP_492800.1 KNL (kinetochore null) Binding Protein [Caenorhabditis elegans]